MAPLTPPAHLAADAATVWNAVVAEHPKPETINALRLEAYCLAVSTLRKAHADLSAADNDDLHMFTGPFN